VGDGEGRDRREREGKCLARDPIADTVRVEEYESRIPRREPVSERLQHRYSNHVASSAVRSDCDPSLGLVIALTEGRVTTMYLDDDGARTCFVRVMRDPGESWFLHETAFFCEYAPSHASVITLIT